MKSSLVAITVIAVLKTFRLGKQCQTVSELVQCYWRGFLDGGKATHGVGDSCLWL